MTPPETSRRNLLAGAIAAAALAPSLAPTLAQAQDPKFAPANAHGPGTDLKVERFPIWPGTPPGYPAAGVKDVFVKRSPTGDEDDIAWTNVAIPMLTVVHPEKPNGAAMLVVPGGGYVRVAVGRHGSDIAQRFAAQGITTFELLYRLPHDGWAAGPDVSLQDAQRALRLIRAGAGTRWQVDPERVAISGYSAGGHLAARAASRPDLVTYAPVDAADRQSARVNVAGLFFPVVTMLDEGVHRQSREQLLGARKDDPEARTHWSTQIGLPADMPPTYVACNADDPVVPPENAILMFRALNTLKIPTELMIFEKGGHGPPAPHKDGTPTPWMALFEAFAGDHGWPVRA
ncbi:alpha/beta hydrolase [Novosphingobium sp. 9]|uniref:alpha/beta hydrolase n=1 Tax=Novosphingobium sp. 9 TaxID=2025349 RepID=UPI0021B6E6A4|nr:alpha/beta hydrolase [Novosphingobium sp. 9]